MVADVLSRPPAPIQDLHAVIALNDDAHLFKVIRRYQEAAVPRDA